MEGESSKIFIDNIVKHIQMLCHGHIPFLKNVEVIGHLYLNIDSNTKMNYIVNEKCCKNNYNTTFTSNSFPAHNDGPSQTTASSSPTTATSSSAASDGSQNSLLGKYVSQSPTKPEKKITRSASKKTKSAATPDGAAQSSKKRKTDNNSLFAAVSVEKVSPLDLESEDNQNLEMDINSNTDQPPHDYDVNDDDDNDITLDDTLDETETSQINDSIEQEVEDINKAIVKLEPRHDVEYTIIEYGTQQGKPLLVDNIGYSYNLRKTTANSVSWRCTKRSKALHCPAMVFQRGDYFVTGKRQHIHEARQGLLTRALIYAEIRNQAISDFETPVSEVVARAMSVRGEMDEDINLPKPVNLKRMINRYRLQKRNLYYVKKETGKVEDDNDSEDTTSVTEHD